MEGGGDGVVVASLPPGSGWRTPAPDAGATATVIEDGWEEGGGGRMGDIAMPRVDRLACSSSVPARVSSTHSSISPSRYASTYTRQVGVVRREKGTWGG